MSWYIYHAYHTHTHTHLFKVVFMCLERLNELLTLVLLVRDDLKQVAVHQRQKRPIKEYKRPTIFLKER
jgi:hypothetical protein